MYTVTFAVCKEFVAFKLVNRSPKHTIILENCQFTENKTTNCRSQLLTKGQTCYPLSNDKVVTCCSTLNVAFLLSLTSGTLHECDEIVTLEAVIFCVPVI